MRSFSSFRALPVAATLFALLFSGSPALADRDLFELTVAGVVGPGPIQGLLLLEEGDNELVDLVEDFLDQAGEFSQLALLPDYDAVLDYMGMKNAVQFRATDNGRTVTMRIPSTGLSKTFSASSPNDVANEIEDWLKDEGADQWWDFLRAANATTPLALLSGNPKSTVALMGDSPYRKFGYDDSRSRFGFTHPVKRWSGFELRLDAGASFIDTKTFDDDLYSFDPQLTLAGAFGRYIGLSFSIVGQIRSYNGAKMYDLGLELALPLTFLHPDRGPLFWQVTPFFQAAAGASKSAVAGGLFVGPGAVNALGFHAGRFEFLMANEISYYKGIPIDDISGFDFETELSQLYFKNGLEVTYWIGAGFYIDGGVHFSNFALDAAAVPWFATPTVGAGWQLGRWMDLRLAYEADLDNNDYRAHNIQLKLDFLF